MIKLNHKEDVITILIDHIRLNRYDTKFINNISSNYISKQRPLSLKQSEVVDLIIKKYQKQLNKIDLNSVDLVSLPWKQEFISPEDIQKKSFFKIENRGGIPLMIMTFAFNKEVISELRALIYDDKKLFVNKNIENDFNDKVKYSFVWDNVNNIWIGEYNQHLFTELYKFALKHNIVIENSIKELLEQTDQFGSKEDWQSQIRIVDNRIYINNIAETMLDTLNGFDLTDLSEPNIENIVTALAVNPPRYYNKNKAELVASTNGTLIYDTESKEAQDELYKYLKNNNKVVLFYLPSKNGWPISGTKVDNKFITDSEITDWDIPNVLMNFGLLITDAHLKCDEEFDVIVTTLSLEALVMANSALAKLATNTKIIRIK